ncbi:MAG: hemerythrin domain-containing protein [Hyphomicrobiaceae bacterium]
MASDEPRVANPSHAANGLIELIDPLDALEHDHAFQLELCDLMEELADSLPVGDAIIAAAVVPVLRQGVVGHMRLEEETLFPLLKVHTRNRPQVEAVTSLLTREHEADVGFLEEVADALDAFVGEGGVENPEMLGYMLRFFFESQRRHIDWENSVLIPLARDVLTAEQLQVLRNEFAKPQVRCNSSTFFKEYRRVLTRRNAVGR